MLRNIVNLFNFNSKKKVHPATFNEYLNLYKAHLAEVPLDIENKNINRSQKKVNILITHWQNTSVPFFSFEIGLYLNAIGFNVNFILDFEDIFFNRSGIEESNLICKFLTTYCSEKNLSITEVKDFNKKDYLADFDTKEKIKNFLDNSLIKHFNGEDNIESFSETIEVSKKISFHLKKIINLLQHNPCDLLILPGGLYGLSGIYKIAANLLNTKIFTYDSGFSSLICAYGGSAANLTDICTSFNILVPFKETIFDRIQASVSEEVEKRKKGISDFKFQNTNEENSNKIDGDVLIPLNLRSDTAALQVTELFPSVKIWLKKTIAWAIEQDVRLIIRQHPVERFSYATSNDKIGEWIKEFDPDNKNTIFVSASDPVNSYTLIQNVKVILPFASTIGVEAVMMGKPVILHTSVYYKDFGFVNNPISEVDYFDLIKKAIDGELMPTTEQIEKAILCYYITQKCNLIKTNFTPQPNDFLNWVKISPSELWESKMLKILGSSIINDVPTSIICAQNDLNLKFY